MRILLFTTSKNSDKSSSWLLLKQMIDRLTNHEVIIFNPMSFRKFNNGFQNNEVIHYFFFLDNILIRKLINKTWKKFNLYLDLYHSRLLSKRIHKIILNRSIDKIWIYNDMLTVLTLNKLLERINIPYHISIFDDLLFNKTFTIYGNKLKNNFISLLTKSSSIDVIVPEQKEYYVEKGLINSQHLTGFTYGGCFKKSISENVIIKNEVKKICLTGNIFGIESFLIFLSAIEDICLNRSIQIDIFTNQNSLSKQTLKMRFARYSQFVNIKKFIPSKEIISTISNYDLAYLQVSFSDTDKHKAITSFPSKTHNYLASTVPILLHSPNYAAVYKFLRDNNLCHPIDTIDPIEIKNNFMKILDQNRRIEIHESIKYFNKKSDANKHFEDLIKILES